MIRKSAALTDGAVSYLEWDGDGPALHFAHANGFNALTYRTLLAQSDDLSDGGLEIVHLAQTK